MAVTPRLLDRRVVVRAALVTTLVAAPGLLGLRIARAQMDPGRPTDLWVAAIGVSLIAFGVGGYLAARRSADLPLSHSAAAAGYAFAALTIGSVVAAVAGRSHIAASLVLFTVLVGALCVCAAVLGGAVAGRRSGAA
ncbi:MAG TPA: hypothetical protein VE990_04185 [Acidimicrobiales bacterium]|nr:hypothetical protein [Acidimicrobiales bacterium]